MPMQPTRAHGDPRQFLQKRELLGLELTMIRQDERRVHRQRSPRERDATLIEEDQVRAFSPQCLQKLGQPGPPHGDPAARLTGLPRTQRLPFGKRPPQQCSCGPLVGVQVSEPLSAHGDHQLILYGKMESGVLANPVRDQKRLHCAAAEYVQSPCPTGKVGQGEVPVQRRRMTNHHECPHDAYGTEHRPGGPTGVIARTSGTCLVVRVRYAFAAMRRFSVAVIVGLLLPFIAQAGVGVGVCLSTGWRIPVAGLPTWEAAGGLSLPPLSAGWQVTGDGDTPRWAEVSAQARTGRFTGGWSLVWDAVGPALRYAQAEVESVTGGVVSRWVWAWADPDGIGVLDFGAWARVGWPADFPAGWAITADLGASPVELELLSPGRDYPVEFSPIGGEALLLHGATLSAWWPLWKVEALFSVPEGLEEIRLTGKIRAGILTITAEHVYTREGSSLTVDPSLWLGVGGFIIHSEIRWTPPLVISGFYVLGFTLQCPVGNAWIELTADLGDHGLVQSPHVVRGSVRVPVARGTEFSMVTWFGGPGSLWGWARTDVALQATVSDLVTLSAGLEVGPTGLLAWEAGVAVCLGSAR